MKNTKDTKIRLFVASYVGMTLTISATIYGLYELRTTDKDNGTITSYVTFDEAYKTINECLDEMDDGECDISWERDYFKQMYYEYVWDIHTYDYEYQEI